MQPGGKWNEPLFSVLKRTGIGYGKVLLGAIGVLEAVAWLTGLDDATQAWLGEHRTLTALLVCVTFAAYFLYMWFREEP